MRRENRSLLDCVRDACPDLSDDDQGTKAVERIFKRTPSQWPTGSAFRRYPRVAEPLVSDREVGLYDAGYLDPCTRAVHLITNATTRAERIGVPAN